MASVLSLCQRVSALALHDATRVAGQVRHMSRVKRRFTRPPFWLPKTTRTMVPENLTPENQSYVGEVVAERFSSPLKADPWPRGEWRKNSIRCGLIARKIGVYPMWTNDGQRMLTTLLQASDNHVVKYIPPEQVQEESFRRKRPSSRLGALVVGADTIDPREITKEYFNIFANVGVPPKKKLTKFAISPHAKLPPGTPLYASHFRPGDYVDVSGITIDRGYHGVMKRWGFSGMPASHGVTKSHRRGGSIGGGGEKARVWPGTKMPGHMGRNRRTLRGVKILRINTQYNVLWVAGPAIPGATGSYVTLYDTVLPLRKPDAPPHFPTLFQDEVELPEELFDESLHVFSGPSISFAE